MRREKHLKLIRARRQERLYRKLWEALAQEAPRPYELATTTGRMSCTDSNFQSLPRTVVGVDMGFDRRTAVVAHHYSDGTIIIDDIVSEEIDVKEG